MQRACTKIINMLSIHEHARYLEYKKNVSYYMERDYCLMDWLYVPHGRKVRFRVKDLKYRRVMEAPTAA